MMYLTTVVSILVLLYYQGFIRSQGEPVAEVMFLLYVENNQKVLCVCINNCYCYHYLLLLVCYCCHCLITYCYYCYYRLCVIQVKQFLLSVIVFLHHLVYLYQQKMECSVSNHFLPEPIEQSVNYTHTVTTHTVTIHTITKHTHSHTLFPKGLT